MLYWGHIDILVEDLELGILWDEHGLVGDINKRVKEVIYFFYSFIVLSPSDVMSPLLQSCNLTSDATTYNHCAHSTCLANDISS